MIGSREGVDPNDPGADPAKDRAVLATRKTKDFLVEVGLMDYDAAEKVCKELVEKEGVREIMLCPGFGHDGVARISRAVGRNVPVGVVRMDSEGDAVIMKMLKDEGWF